MRQHQQSLVIETPGRALVEITGAVADEMARAGIATGLLTLFCRHTSASLTIQENAAPAVQRDILAWLDRIAPEDAGWQHDDEGPDDMPAHLKAILTGVSLTVPVARGRPVLGTWQGIYLVEHRRRPHRREVVVHVLGE